MSAPRATMRLQFHRGFTFGHALPLVQYFASLGISHVYASPIMTARPGSMHGYDAIDVTRVNPELGGEEELRRLVRELRGHRLGLIVDIVPNHMAVGNGNAWWMDVLARGRNSRYAKYFDIDWTPSDPELRGKVLLPILGRPYGEVLGAGELTLRMRESRPPMVKYFDHAFPVAVECADSTWRECARLTENSPAARERLHNLLERQHYRLAWWGSANDRINWRRFFDINELAAMRVEDQEVFDAMHATIFRLYAEGIVDGVRVDHVDGLSFPGQYCRQLRARLRELERERPADCPAGPAYFVVEKILAHDEQLPTAWETNGTTGYDFMDEISAVQHDSAGEQPLTEVWKRVSGRSGDFKTEEQQARRETLQRSFSAQLEATLDVLSAIARGDLGTRDISRAALRRCVTEILVAFPVYRIYAQPGHSSQADKAVLARAVGRAATSCLPSDRWLVQLLGKWLSGEPIRPQADALQAVALTRFQQLSAPLSAKAVEDTAFYRYGRLISRNDVGFDPGRLACSTDQFHARMQARHKDFPHALLATATHDHKRGEDVRARLAVLSEVADDWSNALEGWLTLAREHFSPDADRPRLDPADLTFLFQTVIGAWPDRLEPSDRPAMQSFAKRIAAWQQKALREAKLRTDWLAPNEAYENAASEFVARLFAAPSPLLSKIADFARRIAPAGAINSLAQLLVKLTAPGVPDIYQGTEFWDLSLVDPDNRAPVDFAARQQSLGLTDVAKLAAAWKDGRIKQQVIARILAARKKMPDLFERGDYLPLQIEGPLARHVIAFARIFEASIAVTVCCRHPTALLSGSNSILIDQQHWKNTRVVLPAEYRSRTYSDVLTDAENSGGDYLDAAQILSRLPIAFLISQVRTN